MAPGMQHACLDRRDKSKPRARGGLSPAAGSSWRDGLFDRLWDIGVRGRLWRITRNLSQGSRSRVVVVNGQKSDFFPIDQGVVHCHTVCHL